MSIEKIPPAAALEQGASLTLDENLRRAEHREGCRLAAFLLALPKTRKTPVLTSPGTPLNPFILDIP